jgi:hypothetical protein
MNIKEIVIPDGWVIDKQIGNKLILKEDNNVLNDWTKCYKKLLSEGELCYINKVSDLDYDSPENSPICWTNTFPKKYEHPMFALMQLLTCYQAWVGDWKPDWDDCHPHYVITVIQNQLVRESYISANKLLAFPTEEMCDDFFHAFKDLLEDAKPLL